jgi:hypothetical protein
MVARHRLSRCATPFTGDQSNQKSQKSQHFWKETHNCHVVRNDVVDRAV